MRSEVQILSPRPFLPDRRAITRQVDVGGGQTKANLFQMRADGTDVIRVTNGPEDDYPADWGTYPLVD